MSGGRDLRTASAGPASAYATHEAWLAEGARLVESRSTASWAFADWLRTGVDAWGEAALREAVNRSGNSPRKISNYLTTAKTYPPNRRRFALTFSHHLEVARLAPEEAERILDEAEAEGWTRGRTREVARDATQGGEIERLRRENAALKRRLKGKMIDPRAFAAQARDKFAASRRLMRGEGRRNAALAEAMAESEALEALHGNARLGLARDILRAANNLVADTDAYTERMAKAATVIRGPQ